MKKLLLFLLLTVSINLIQAQQQISYVQYTNLQTFSSEPDSLYNGHNHDYYNAIFKKATKLRNAGIILTSVGVGLFVGSQIASNTNLNTTTILFLSSVSAISAGTPLWISGSVKRKNNRKAMEKIKGNMSISFRTTPNGVGLVLNF
ncbi:hypothetical protein ACFLS7_01835 [Bacteroidota bacterium]